MIETCVMVMRLCAPLHAYPASHSRFPKPSRRNVQKGTAALIYNLELSP